MCAQWPANGETDWNTKMLAYNAVEHGTDGTHEGKIVLTSIFGASTNLDSDGNAIAKTHAYLAPTDGIVNAWVLNNSNGTTFYISGYVGATDDPAGAGTLEAKAKGYVQEDWGFISFPVPKDAYFEVITGEAAATVTIRWRAIGTLSAPVDQD